MAAHHQRLIICIALCIALAHAQLPLGHHQQQHRLRSQTSCRIEQLRARRPTFSFQSEAGLTEYWDANAAEFQCAGAEFARHLIHPKALLLPYYTNAPHLLYVVKGSSGILGTAFPGCAETYEFEPDQDQQRSKEGSKSFHDRHQKLRRFRRGDVLALQQGIAHWIYNDGDTPLVIVSLLDVANENNQLDFKFRKFFLAGNPQAVQTQGLRRREARESRKGGEEEEEKRNIFTGFDEELLAEIFNLEPEVIRKLQGNDDNRGTIVKAENLRLVFPEWGEEEQERRRDTNGLEETFCAAKLRQNIDHPSVADVYNPRGGRIRSLNSHDLPILSSLRLSAERGILYKNALVSPHYTTNAHSVIYATRGGARIQVVGNEGNPVFDGEVSEGELLIVPQNFVVIKKAGEEGFEYIAFKTNDNAMKSHLAGRLSAIRAMPEDVLVNSYGISKEQAKELKYNREEAAVFSPGSVSGRHA
ncbi:11S globulin subunit beta-like [Andrographis paniculata]|uniref:11S globulin subunit beta-like n=1 Tax=Andrographis paniculata TaxID=175694 RepID=UPI0021E6E41F|nr:11S globulin subunit beta-like [Andrographis paniculata]